MPAAGEIALQPSTHDIERFGIGEESPAESQHVGVVVLAGKLGVPRRWAKGCSYTGHLVRGDRFPLAATAEHETPGHSARRDLLAHLDPDRQLTAGQFRNPSALPHHE